MSTPLLRMLGGLRLTGHKSAASLATIRVLPPAPRLLLPLDTPGCGSARPCVRVGESVRRGQTLAAATLAGALPIHAPTSGIVSALAFPCARVPRGGGHRSASGGSDARCLVLDSDGLDTALDTPEWPPCDDPGTLPIERIRERLLLAGIAGLGGAGFPTHAKLHGRIDTVVINGAECEPFVACDDALMRDPSRAADALSGALAVARSLGAQRLLIGIEDDKPEAIANLRRLCALAPAELPTAVVSLPARYPQGDARQLIRSLTGREVAHDGVALDVGVLALNVATAGAIWRALRLAEPLLARIVTVNGPSLQAAVNVEVRLGTPWRSLLQALELAPPPGARLRQGGAMMGVAAPSLDVPVTVATQCILIDTPAPAAAEQPCIRCADCAEVCPQRLQPQLLWAAQRGDRLATLRQLALNDCIECGACDQVCPSRLPLASRFAAAKQRLAQDDAAQRQAAAARSRHAAHLLRRQRQADEDAQARERRKALLDAGTDSARPDPVAAALARARARKSPPPT